MSLCYQRRSEVMSATTRFHAYEAGRCVGQLAKQLALRWSSLDDDVSGLVQPNHVKNSLSQINTDGAYIHALMILLWISPLDCSIHEPSQSGGPSH
jgi:hypothetical protein